MIEYYLIKRNLIGFPKRTISISFIWARTFDQARTDARTFDRVFVRGEYNDLKYCRRIFYYAAGNSGMCLNFLLVDWKNWWWNFYWWSGKNIWISWRYYSCVPPWNFFFYKIKFFIPVYPRWYSVILRDFLLCVWCGLRAWCQMLLYTLLPLIFALWVAFRSFSETRTPVVLLILSENVWKHPSVEVKTFMLVETWQTKFLFSISDFPGVGYISSWEKSAKALLTSFIRSALYNYSD